ncbi:hypothetical protein AgCh_023230 [Apium graveolens]
MLLAYKSIKKFSRRKLKKGSHYFDSLTDVLQKVAEEPKHLELEPETENIIEDKEEGGSEPDVVPNKRRRCYLQPVTSKYNPKEYQNNTGANYSQKHMDNIVENGAITNLKECVINYARNHMPSSPDASNASLRNQKTSISNDMQSSKMMKFHFSRKR